MIDDSEIRNRMATLGIRANPAPTTRGNSTEEALRGTPEFKKLLRALDVEWVLNSRDLDRIEAIRMDGDEFEVRDRGSDVWETIAE